MAGYTTISLVLASASWTTLGPIVAAPLAIIATIVFAKVAVEGPVERAEKNLRAEQVTGDE